MRFQKTLDETLAQHNQPSVGILVHNIIILLIKYTLEGA